MNALAKESLLEIIGCRIESRYRRLVFVHEELAKLDSQKGGKPPARPLPGESFEDYVFKNIDFSIYKRIEAEEFYVIFVEGLHDYNDSFYQKSFAMNRRETSRIIQESYTKEGAHYLCNKPGFMLLSIMRTLHSSLDFAPLFDEIDFLSKDHYKEAAECLDGMLIRHKDGRETKLFMPKEPDSRTMPGKPLLCGTFFPMGKACTLSLIK